MESLRRLVFGSKKRDFILRLLSFALVISALPGCGHKKSKDIGMAVLPEKPIVITADAKDVFGQTTAAPWFAFRPVISNGSSSMVTIIALKLSITGLDEQGSITTVTREYVPSSWGWSRTTTTTGTSGPVTVTTPCQFTHFGEYASGIADQQLYLGGDASCPPCDSGGDSVPGDTFCVPRPEFRFGGGPGGPENAFTTWTVRMVPLGWFGSYLVSEDRFTGSATFRTQ